MSKVMNGQTDSNLLLLVDKLLAEDNQDLSARSDQLNHLF